MYHMNISQLLIGLALTLSSAFLFYKEFKRKKGSEDDELSNYLDFTRGRFSFQLATLLLFAGLYYLFSAF